MSSMAPFSNRRRALSRHGMRAPVCSAFPARAALFSASSAVCSPQYAGRRREPTVRSSYHRSARLRKSVSSVHVISFFVPAVAIPTCWDGCLFFWRSGDAPDQGRNNGLSDLEHPQGLPAPREGPLPIPHTAGLRLPRQQKNGCEAPVAQGVEQAGAPSVRAAKKRAQNDAV